MIDVEVVTINYMTPQLVLRLYRSVRRFISATTPFRVIDGSTNNSLENILTHGLAADENLIIERIGYNIHHGRGMNYAIATTKHSHVLFMDSDGYAIKGGLLEYMMGSLRGNSYGCGFTIRVTPRGVTTNGDGITYLHPRCMLIRVSEYNKYPRFTHHGAPCIKPMIAIHSLGDDSKLVGLDRLDEYFLEDGRGTVSEYGYGVSKGRGEIRISILIRTSGRPNYFRKCYESVARQSYSNYAIIVSCDDDESEEYVGRYNVDAVVRVERIAKELVPSKYYESMGQHASAAPYNGYFKEMYEFVSDGYIIHLDDDDAFNCNDTLSIINEFVKLSDDMFLIWRVLFPNGLKIPSDSNWEKPPKCAGISGIGYSFHNKHKHLAEWGLHRCGDFRTAKHMYENLKDTVFIDRLLTKVQRASANGVGRRDDI